jgi:hypothetical protein
MNRSHVRLLSKNLPLPACTLGAWVFKVNPFVLLTNSPPICKLSYSYSTLLECRFNLSFAGGIWRDWRGDSSLFCGIFKLWRRGSQLHPGAETSLRAVVLRTRKSPFHVGSSPKWNRAFTMRWVKRTIVDFDALGACLDDLTGRGASMD